jgi:hypothetical protein
MPAAQLSAVERALAQALAAALVKEIRTEHADRERRESA